jgi:hypothetical protein
MLTKSSYSAHFQFHSFVVIIEFLVSLFCCYYCVFSFFISSLLLFDSFFSFFILSSVCQSLSSLIKGTWEETKKEKSRKIDGFQFIGRFEWPTDESGILADGRCYKKKTRLLYKRVMDPHCNTARRSNLVCHLVSNLASVKALTQNKTGP